MPNLTEEQIQLYQAFGGLMPGDQFVTSSGTVAVIEAIQSMIDASLLKDKAESVNNAEPLLKDKVDDLVHRLRNPIGTSGSDFNASYWMGITKEAADRIETLEAALRLYAGFESNGIKWEPINDKGGVARAALAGEKKDE